jgi:hypothetical protein
MTTLDNALAYAAALAGLPEMTPVRLVSVLETLDPIEAWTALAQGTNPGDPKRRFAAAARATDPAEVGERYRRVGVQILLPGQGGYPSRLVGDPGAPAVLFSHGDPSVLEDRRQVAIVGTRSATPYGRQVAADLGRDLASAGVVVVSGLARGIDGAAHAGALSVAVGDGAAPGSTSSTRRPTPSSGSRSPHGGWCFRSHPSEPCLVPRCSRPGTGSSRLSAMSWWLSRVITGVVASTRWRRQPDVVSRWPPFPDR